MITTAAGKGDTRPPLRGGRAYTGSSMPDPLDAQCLAAQEAVRGKFNDWVREGKARGMERRHRRLAEHMFARFELEPNDRVLDIGCGDGWTARMIAPLLPEGAVVGIDIADEMIGEARRLSGALDNVLFAPAPAERIPWAEDYFTHVIGIESAYYWPSPERVAQEIFRVAAYGGRFHLLFNFYRENPYSHDWPDGMGLAMQLKSAAEWAELFRARGFERVETERIPDDSPIPDSKQGREREIREGLQREGALYLSGRKPALPPRAAQPPALRVLG